MRSKMKMWIWANAWTLVTLAQPPLKFSSKPFYLERSERKQENLSNWPHRLLPLCPPFPRDEREKPGRLVKSSSPLLWWPKENKKMAPIWKEGRRTQVKSCVKGCLVMKVKYVSPAAKTVWEIKFSFNCKFVVFVNKAFFFLLNVSNKYWH